MTLGGHLQTQLPGDQEATLLKADVLSANERRMSALWKLTESDSCKGAS